MLILTRRADEVIRVGDDIRIKVLGFKGGQIRLGIDAPRGIPVHREEIWLRIEQDSPKSAGVP
jgi:carbon storage regulator